ncbi:DJ-1 [Trametes versicolor FP-101664 SS1]|uniref:DJ-1 n=1 Tax=Trametes versicolor (strain FP-101664) TaxID=717944 RepID=UPI0004622417|nr:DJ-1 [Trametes versicolor FP-101664 SS1]EIW55537.1 DJ-1 [Trametes versicolor FP-101664 SS1]
MPSALILIADGTEEMEFTITYDTLVRAGVACTSAFVSERDEGDDHRSHESNPPFVKGSRGIRIVPDIYFSPSAATPDKFDLLVIPGGAKGAATISGNASIQHLVKEYLQAGKFVGMICAGSLAASTAGLPRQPITSHPSVRDQLKDDFDYSEESVVISGKLVTSRGPGTTFPFALTLVELLCGKEKRAEVAGPMVFPQGTFA